MDEWSKVEMQISRLLAATLKADIDEMPVLMNALRNRGQQEALKTLLLPRLSAITAQKLEAILLRLKTNATKRNHIVHGFWHLEVVICDRNGIPWPNYRQFRRYDPSNKEIREAMDRREDPNARKAYMFSLPRIRGITSELGRVWVDLSLIDESDIQDRAKKSVYVISTDAPSIAED